MDPGLLFRTLCSTKPNGIRRPDDLTNVESSDGRNLERGEPEAKGEDAVNVAEAMMIRKGPFFTAGVSKRKQTGGSVAVEAREVVVVGGWVVEEGKAKKGCRIW